MVEKRNWLMKINLGGRINGLYKSVRQMIAPAGASAVRMSEELGADVLVKSSSSALRVDDPVLAEIARSNSLVMNTPKHPHPFMPVKDFLQVMDPFEHKVVGELPEYMQRCFPDKPSDAITFFGELSSFLRTEDGMQLCESRPVKLPSGQQLSARYVKSGAYGDVFNVGDEGNPFALKVFKDRYIDPSSIVENGPIAEARTDAFLSDFKYKDFRKFYMTDISGRARWTLAEFIQHIEDRSQAKALFNQRDGVLLKKVHPEMRFGDVDISGNYLLAGNLRIESGGAYLKGKRDESALSVLEAKYPDLFPQPPECYHFAPEHIRNLPVEQREAAFEKLLSSSDPQTRSRIADAIEFLPSLARKKAYYTLLGHQDSSLRVGLGDQAKFLFYDEAPDALKAAIRHPDAGVSAKMLNDIKELLPSNEQKEVASSLMSKILAPYKTFSLGEPATSLLLP